MFCWTSVFVLVNLLRVVSPNSCKKIKDHQNGEQLVCANITSLFLENLISSLHSTRSLICTNCSLSTIHENTFNVSMNHIISLALFKSHISTICNFAFAKFPFLKVLKLSNNEIEFLDRNSLKNISNLFQLDLSNNKISHIPYSLLSNLENLDLLNLNHNSLVHIQPEFFIGLKRLKYLYLSSNSLRGLDKECFRDLISLKILYLENNLIIHITPEVFVNLKKLEYLYLNNNSISRITPYNFKLLPSLIDLQLRENKLQEIEESSFNGLRKVRYLYLGGNSLKTIKVYGFMGLDSLQMLDLTKNKFEDYIFDYLSNMKNLDTLWLNENMLNNIMLNYKLDPFSNLRILGLSANNLSTVNYKLLYNKIPNVSHIFISNNPWKCEFLVNMYNFFQAKSVKLCSNEKCNDTSVKTYIEDICSKVVIKEPKEEEGFVTACSMSKKLSNYLIFPSLVKVLLF